MCILFEKLKSLPSGNVVCFVETDVSESRPLPVCRQFRGEAVVELSRFHPAAVLDGVNLWGCHGSGGTRTE